MNKDSTADSLNTDKELAEALANHLSVVEDSALTQLREPEGQVCDLENQIAQRESELEELSKSKSAADENLEHSRAECIEISASISKASLEQSLRNEMANLTAANTMLEKDAAS